MIKFWINQKGYQLPLFLLLLLCSLMTSVCGKEVIGIGYVYYPNRDLTIAEQEIQKIIADTFGNTTYIEGKNYDVQLVLQTDVGWRDSNPAYGEYNFSWYLQFAELLKKYNIEWTPLLSYHYWPHWVVEQAVQDFGHDPRMRDENGNVTGGNFLPLSPSSPVWATYASDWTKKAMEAFKPYMGTTIKVIFLGNEVMYGLKPESYDSYTLQRWKEIKGDESAELPKGMESKKDHQLFRSNEWENMFCTLFKAARSVLNPELNVKFGTKLVPYAITSAWILKHGVFPSFFSVMNYSDIIGYDAYPPASHLQQIVYRQNVLSYLAEFNTTGNKATGVDVLTWLRDGLINYNMQYATFFSWNGTNWVATEDQKKGLRDAINWIVSEAQPRLSYKQRVHYVYSDFVLDATADVGWTVSDNSYTRMTAPTHLGRHFKLDMLVDYTLGTTSDKDADVNIVQVTTPIEIDSFAEKRIFFIDSASAKVTNKTTGYYVTVGPNGARTDSIVKIATANFKAGEDVFTTTKSLTTNLPWYQVLASANDMPTVIRVENTIFVTEGVVYAMGGSEKARRYIADLGSLLAKETEVPIQYQFPTIALADIENLFFEYGRFNLRSAWGGTKNVIAGTLSSEYFRKITNGIEVTTAASPGYYSVILPVELGSDVRALTVSADLKKNNLNQSNALYFSVDGENWVLVGANSTHWTWEKVEFDYELASDKKIELVFLKWEFSKPGDSNIWVTSLGNLRVIGK